MNTLPHHPWHSFISKLMLVVLLISAFASGTPPEMAGAQTTGEGPSPASLAPATSYAVKQDRIDALPVQPAVPQENQPDADRETLPFQTLPKIQTTGAAEIEDAALQDLVSVGQMPATDFNFEGVDNRNGVLPPDTNGDVGPNHYVQWVNLSMQIWQLDRVNHTVTSVYGPTNGNAIWAGFGGYCETSNDGDPIVLYDHLAGRWMISQFALPNYPNGPFYQCVAVSQDSDPTLGWYRYAFLISNTKMNDYPHLGVWPDGYYMSINQFDTSGSWAGAGVVVFERDKMLQGLTARQVYFDLYSVNSNYGGMLPSDLDGTPPPAGTPNYFAEVDDSTWLGDPADTMRIWEFHVDWNNTSNSSFGISGDPNDAFAVSNFTPICIGTRNCVPQPGTTRKLDAIGDRLMHRLQYRYFGTYATLVTNHTVDAGGGRAGVRWYEMRKSGGSWSIHQQGTYAGDGTNSEHRWMGSAAMDGSGNIAVGYSASSSTIYPSVRYTGRLAGDALNTLPQGEASIIAGSGAQTSSYSRWGDYSMISVDPTDDCTFWYTNEYLTTTSNASWRTRVGSFTFPSCNTPQPGTLQGHVTDSSTGLPIEGAAVSAGGFDTLTDPDGFYQFLDLAAGNYSVTASKYGYTSQTTNVTVSSGATTTQNFALVKAPLSTVTGTVKDGSGQGWPLYARIDITAPNLAETIFTDPVTGAYSIQLAQGSPHNFTITAVSAGYSNSVQSVTPTTLNYTQNFVLFIDSSACTAPGYVDPGSGCTAETGGLLVGNVYDENTAAALNGTNVLETTQPGSSTTTFATPNDPGVDDGFYILFSPHVGTVSFTAEYALMGYGPRILNATIQDKQVTAQDFNLPAGVLAADPVAVEVSLRAEDIMTTTVTLLNSGGYEATFSLEEVNAPVVDLQPTGPFASATRHVSPKALAALTASGVYDYVPPTVPAWSSASYIGAWNTGLSGAWGVAFDAETGMLWVGDTAAGGGSDTAVQFLPTGVATGKTISTDSAAVYASGIVYNPFTNTLWQLHVSGDNCMVELDPASLAPTGKSICPAFGGSQRALAFNPLDGSFYAASWTDGILYHFDANGRMLDSKNLNLNFSGLAFHPATGHLYALMNADLGYDVYVLDVDGGYNVLGGFDLPGMDSFQAGGLAIDCSGHLWAVNQETGALLEADTGEDGACAWADVTWFSVDPTSGSVPAAGSTGLTYLFDASGLAVGNYQAKVVINNNTPYGVVEIPVTMHVLDPHDFAAGPAEQNGSAPVGSQVVYNLQITNNGLASDSYEVSISGGWVYSIDGIVASTKTIGPVAAGATQEVEVVVMVPVGALPGDVNVATATITSVANPLLEHTTTLTTTVKYGLFLPLVQEKQEP